jgi:hypothetical protein
LTAKWARKAGYQGSELLAIEESHSFAFNAAKKRKLHAYKTILTALFTFNA